MVNLSIGLAYVHYALKRQSINRQYLILQGLSFMSSYARHEIAARGNDDTTTSEVNFNIGRLYHLLGITSLAMQHYAKEAALANRSTKNIKVMRAMNEVVALIALKRPNIALNKMKKDILL